MPRSGRMTRRRALGLGAVLLVVGALAVARRGREPAAGRTIGGDARDGQRPGGDRPARSGWIAGWRAQPGAGTWRVAGVVRHAGRPVAGAKVRLELTGEDAVGLEDEAVEVATAADGGFDLGERPAVELVVTASAPGREPAGVRLDLRRPAPTPTPDRLVLELADCARTVAGRVRDASSGAIGGARIRGRFAGGVATTIAADDGTFAMCLAPDAARLTAEADGYATGACDVPAARRVRCDFDLAPAIVLSGRVIDEADAPVDGAVVTATDGERAAGAVAGADGRFAVTGLPPGRYQLTARAAGQASAPPVELSARVGETTDEIVLRTSRTVTVRGRVVEDGRPVADAEVGLAGEDFRHRAAVSQADGGFAIEVLPGAQTVDVRDHDVEEPATFRAEPPGTTLTVRVRHRARLRGRVVRRGVGVVGAAVVARPTTGEGAAGLGPGGNQRATRSGPAGAFELTGLVPSTYRVVAQDERAFTRGREVEIAAGRIVDGVVLELDLAASVAGVVVDQRGAPVAGVHVELALPPGRDFGDATTGEDGAFEAGAMSGGGDYQLSVRRQRGAGAVFAAAPGHAMPVIALRDGASRVEGVRVAIRVEAETIAGRVLDADGQPAPDVAVFAQTGVVPLGWSGGGAAGRAVSSADGGFVLRDLLPGTYQLRATSGAGLTAEAFGVTAGRADVVLRLPGVGGIEGTLAGFGPRVAVRISNPSDRDLRRYRAWVRGDRFEIRDLPPGPYRVEAQDGERLADARVEVAVGATATVALRPQPTGVVHGRLVDARSRSPLAGASCFGRIVDGGAVARIAFTDADGRFDLVLAAGRPSEIFCDHARGVARASVQVAAGAAVELVVPMVVETLPGSEARDVGLALMADRPQVTAIAAGGAAERAGVRPRDVLVSVDGIAVAGFGAHDTLTLLLDRPVGARARVVLTRDGAERTVEIEVVARRGE